MSLAHAVTEILQDRYRSVRAFTKKICEPLQTEDYIVQSMPDASPARWHLAHTTWFFETFILKPYSSEYRPQNEAFEYLFNSYYNAVGKPYPRHQRGLLTRPSVQEVWDYRDAVDKLVLSFLESETADDHEIAKVVELGLQHEQQHQELMLTDIKHMLSRNPLFPSYRKTATVQNQINSTKAEFVEFKGGVQSIGYAGNEFCFDNEQPTFEHLLQDYALQDRLVTNGEFLEFIEDGAYTKPNYWLSMGWGFVQQDAWNAPLYWVRHQDKWHEFTLDGLQPLNLNQPVCHVSYFEADAYATWSGSRLPTEFEWENAAADSSREGNFAESECFQPTPANPKDASKPPRQMFGDVWEWTRSQYSPYPGYKPLAGALGEYNGKFMCNQFVLKGGSCATPQSHIRATYRNFFPPEARWQFTGIRLAK